MRKQALLRGRMFPAGRAVLNSAFVAARPFDYVERRWRAAQYTRRFPSTWMAANSGHALLPPGSLPQTPEVMALCRELFARKKAALEAVAPTGKQAGRDLRKKRGFLKNLLTDDDLRANPLLVEFALSDPLLSMVTNYFGTVPHLNRIDLVYSVPRPTTELIASQLFHQDPEGLRQAKVFLYVYDVDDRHGPFTFIPARDSERLVRSIRRRRLERGAPQESRYQDAEIESEGGFEALVSVKGPEGSGVIIDTSRCLHSGSRVHAGFFRLCFFLQYCTSNEKSNLFDAERYRDDPVRWLALKEHADRGGGSVAGRSGPDRHDSGMNES